MLQEQTEKDHVRKRFQKFFLNQIIKLDFLLLLIYLNFKKELWLNIFFFLAI